MSLLPSVFARTPRRFGRGRFFRRDAAAESPPAADRSADLRLFVMTFLGGFLFVAVYLA